MRLALGENTRPFLKIPKAKKGQGCGSSGRSLVHETWVQWKGGRKGGEEGGREKEKR
jgi:hypothetical protein